MKSNTLFKLSLLLLFLLTTTVKAQIVNIPDANFKAKLLQADANSANHYAQDLSGNWVKIDLNGNNEIEISEALSIGRLEIKGLISDLTGIEFFTNLRSLDCGHSNLSNLNLSNNTALTQLNCGFNQLTNLNLSSNTALTQLNCEYNELTSLDVSNNLVLTQLNCSVNKISSLNLINNTLLTNLDCSHNQLTSLSVSINRGLIELNCSYNRLTSLDVSSNTALKNLNCTKNQLTSLVVSNNTELIELSCSYNQLTSLDVSSNVLLTSLSCGNNQLTGLVVSNNTALTKLGCKYNQLTNLNINSNRALIQLDCGHNQLTNLDVNTNTFLLDLYCEYNQLTSLNLDNNIALQQLWCDHNHLTSLNVNNNTGLFLIFCFNNELTSLDLNNNILLSTLGCAYNRLTTLDLNNNKELMVLNCNSNQLISLFVKNDVTLSIGFSSNPNLTYVCVDESNLDNINNLIAQYGYTNCNVNTYCTFVPGGVFYTINGSHRYDGNNNGCDINDSFCSNLKFNITNGTNTGTIVSNASGNYSIPVQAGTHTITPQLENPAYFNFSPASFTANFPTQASPLIQDICITPNGAHPDLEIKIIPISFARPGFNVIYEVFYKNKGNQVETPIINFNFDDTVMDYVSSTQAPNTQATGLLTWNLGNVQPFASGSFRVTFKINRPTDTPPVNGNDVLSYIATINDTAFTDETPNDNTFTLNQTVVNSFDPNDKTCLEGKTIDPSKIGEYVTYQIRFENTGTYPATNIVVKDMIDTAKFDVNSLQMVKASHNCYTRIKDNKVEFIFENINLPIDDANNDGYVVFKIKSLSALSVGSTISNSANIYFDYNFPITTNTATTTYQVLANQAFEFDSEFKLYPVPTRNVLNIQSKVGKEISSLEVYNTLGQLIMVAPDFKDSLDVSAIQTGTYFIKVNADKGSATTKFVKE